MEAAESGLPFAAGVASGIGPSISRRSLEGDEYGSEFVEDGYGDAGQIEAAASGWRLLEVVPLGPFAAAAGIRPSEAGPSLDAALGAEYSGKEVTGAEDEGARFEGAEVEVEEDDASDGYEYYTEDELFSDVEQANYTTIRLYSDATTIRLC